MKDCNLALPAASRPEPAANPAKPIKPVNPINSINPANPIKSARSDRSLWRFRRPRNRLTVCPECGGKLSFDRDAVTSERGFIYRARPCLGCGALIHTKQGPEELCGAEVRA